MNGIPFNFLLGYNYRTGVRLYDASNAQARSHAGSAARSLTVQRLRSRWSNGGPLVHVGSPTAAHSGRDRRVPERAQEINVRVPMPSPPW